MADPGELLIRADGDASRGLGHLMRGLALGHAWAAAGGRVALATAGGTEGVEAELNELAATVLPVAGPAGSVADAEATRLETEYDQARIKALIENDGWA